MEEKPEPIALVNKTKPDAEPLAYACGKCGIVFGPDQEELARQHCRPNICECGAKCDQQYYTRCSACMQKKARERQQSLAEKAQKISHVDYDAPVFVEDAEGHSVGCREGFFMSVDEAIEWLGDEDPEELPSKVFVWGSTPVSFQTDATWIVESMLEEHYEDARDNISGEDIKELQKLLDGWCEKQHIESYTQTHGILITGIEEEVVASRKAGELEEKGQLGDFLNYVHGKEDES